MKFLCLHGAIGNKENFGIQLRIVLHLAISLITSNNYAEPLEDILRDDSTAAFHYINGPRDIDPPEGFKEYFGAGPHYRWFEDEGRAEESMVARVRRLPDGDSPEDVMRALMKSSSTDEKDTMPNLSTTLKYVYDILDADPEIQGLIGYSEGSCLAGTLILDEKRRLLDQGRQPQIKCALFFTGWPPFGAEGKALLSDESKTVIEIPTLHVIGANDPYKDGAIALYNVCDPDTAVLFDTGKGHTLPRAGRVLDELKDEIRELIEVSRRG